MIELYIIIMLSSGKILHFSHTLPIFTHFLGRFLGIPPAKWLRAWSLSEDGERFEVTGLGLIDEGYEWSIIW